MLSVITKSNHWNQPWKPRGSIFQSPSDSLLKYLYSLFHLTQGINPGTADYVSDFTDFLLTCKKTLMNNSIIHPNLTGELNLD